MAYVGTGIKVHDPKFAVYVTPLATNRSGVAAADATPAAVPTAAQIDLSQSRLGANNIVLLYVYGALAFSATVQLWMDVAAQGDPSKWVKIGAQKVVTTSSAAEGELMRFDNVPSGLLAPQLVAVTAAVNIYEQHTT